MYFKKSKISTNDTIKKPILRFFITELELRKLAPQDKLDCAVSVSVLCPKRRLRVCPVPEAQASGVCPVPEAQASGGCPVPEAQASGVCPVPEAQASG